tara:strand:+ start:442 stop:591 length:150 start_codon:yes stop_codon:yes gene_type:complete
VTDPEVRIDLRSGVRLAMAESAIREHGLTEAELLEAYSHLQPDGEEVDQ